MKNLIYKFSWLGIIFSPLVLPKIFFYFGEIKVGTPYFLPRRWVKYTQEDMEAAAEKQNSKNRKLVRDGIVDAEKIRWRRPEEWKGYKKTVPKKFGIDIVSLGWKTKWDRYRHEWNPGISIVGFGKQLNLCFTHPDRGLAESSYWEAWLTYKNTKGTKEERFKAMIDDYSCTWIGTKNGKKIRTDYYLKILRVEWLNKYAKLNDYYGW